MATTESIGAIMTLVKSSLMEFSLDAQASLFTAQAFASGIVAVGAHSPKFAIRDFSGKALFSPDDISESSLDLTVKLSSVELMDDVRSPGN